MTMQQWVLLEKFEPRFSQPLQQAWFEIRRRIRMESVEWSRDSTTFFTSFRLCSKSNNRERRQSIVQFQDSLWFLLMCFLAPLNHWAPFMNVHLRMRKYSYHRIVVCVRTHTWVEGLKWGFKGYSTQQHTTSRSRTFSSWSGLCCDAVLCRVCAASFLFFGPIFHPLSLSLSHLRHIVGKSYFRQWCENLQILLLMNNKRRRDDAMIQRGWGKGNEIIAIGKIQNEFIELWVSFPLKCWFKKTYIYLSAQCNSRRGIGEKIS